MAIYYYKTPCISPSSISYSFLPDSSEKLERKMFSTVTASLYGVGGSCSESFAMENASDLSPRSIAESKAFAASNSHKEAERRRRKRINAHISTLKSILPNVTKTDKASLLGEAVRRVRELNKAAAELLDDETPLKVLFPSEADEVKVSPVEEEEGLVKATMCCEDRPEMVVDLIKALKSVEAKVVKAEMSTMGGRTKSVLWVQLNVGCESDVGLATLRRALKGVVEKSSFLPGSGPAAKRTRYYPL